MEKNLIRHCLVATVICLGCSTSPNFVEPLYGSECVIVVHETGAEGPDFGLTADHDLGVNPDETRLTLDLYTYHELIMVGGVETTTDRKYQLIVFDPFGTAKLYMRDTFTGATWELEFEDYTGSTNPAYDGATVIAEYSEADMGTWIHILIGAESEHGVRVLVVKVT